LDVKRARFEVARVCTSPTRPTDKFLAETRHAHQQACTYVHDLTQPTHKQQDLNFL